jgi:hypothetical protein
MAKFNIEVELDWVGEDYTIDEKLQESIANKIVSKIKGAVMDEIRDTAIEISKNRVGLWVNQLLSSIMEDHKIPYKESDYSSEVKMITMEEMIGKQFEAALNQTVDKDGEPTNSSYKKYGTRLEWLTGKLARKYADMRVQEFVRDIKGDIENYTSEKVKEEMMKQLTAQLVSNIDFNKVFKEDD